MHSKFPPSALLLLFSVASTPTAEKNDFCTTRVATAAMPQKNKILIRLKTSHKLGIQQKEQVKNDLSKTLDYYLEALKPANKEELN